jgi:hypothetical protein
MGTITLITQTDVSLPLMAKFHQHHLCLTRTCISNAFLQAIDILYLPVVHHVLQMHSQVKINRDEFWRPWRQSTATSPVAWKLPISPTARAETMPMYGDF